MQVRGWRGLDDGHPGVPCPAGQSHRTRVSGECVFLLLLLLLYLLLLFAVVLFAVVFAIVFVVVGAVIAGVRRY